MLFKIYIFFENRFKLAFFNKSDIFLKNRFETVNYIWNYFKTKCYQLPWTKDWDLHFLNRLEIYILFEKRFKIYIFSKIDSKFTGLFFKNRFEIVNGKWTHFKTKCYSLASHYSMDPFMFFQISCLIERLVAYWTAEWLLTRVNSFVGFQMMGATEYLVTLRTAVWFLINMDAFMCLQMSCLTERLVAYWTAEWLLTRVYSFVGL